MSLMEQIKKSNLSNGNSHDIFSIIRNEMDRTFDHFTQSWSSLSNVLVTDNFQVRPFLDVHENEQQFMIDCELPGVDEKDVTIALSNGRLVIKGHKKSRHEENAGDCHISERSFGSFERELLLPESVDEEKIEAKFEKGILKIIAQKHPMHLKNERRIPIGA